MSFDWHVTQRKIYPLLEVSAFIKIVIFILKVDFQSEVTQVFFSEFNIFFHKE